MSKGDNIAPIKRLINKVIKEEDALAKSTATFELENVALANYLKEQGSKQKKIDNMWQDVKDTLIEAGYFDVIENDNFKVSVTKVLGIKVVDIERLPKEYTETVKVAKVDKIKKHAELYDELPDGTVETSYYRLNKKVK